MRIKILRTIGKKDTLPRGPDNSTSLELPAKPNGTMYQEGESDDFSEDDAEKFIRSGCGEPEGTGEPQRARFPQSKPAAPSRPTHEPGEKK